MVNVPRITDTIAIYIDKERKVLDLSNRICSY